MFTPPPSPQPRPRAEDVDPLTELDLKVDVVKSSFLIPPAASSTNEMKLRTGRRTRWAVLLVPLVVILITASTRYLTHPVAFDVFTESPTWETLKSKGIDWRPHKRHPEPEPQFLNTSPSSTTGVSSGTPVAPSNPSSPSTTAATAQPLPTVPSTPPALPTPFPQPYDSDLTQNFSSISCFNFFSNMTNAAEFRSCRPFSMLAQSSSQFLEAQHNLTLINSIVWGTCNTKTTEDQCVANMGWFASSIKTACAQDLTDRNTMAVDTLMSLQAYELMHDAGCQVDPTTNAYCFISAVHNPNPSDIYFYQLPLGLNLPKSAEPSCSACTRSLMSAYAEALKDPTQSVGLTGLRKTYSAAAQLAIKKCGDQYAVSSAASGAKRTSGQMSSWLGGMSVLASLILFFVSP